MFAHSIRAVTLFSPCRSSSQFADNFCKVLIYNVLAQDGGGDYWYGYAWHVYLMLYLYVGRFERKRMDDSLCVLLCVLLCVQPDI